MATLKARAGQHITKYIADMLAESNRLGEQMVGDFNDTPVTVNPGDDPDKVYDAWEAERHRRAEEYRKSPAGIAAEKRDEEYRRIAAEKKAKADADDGPLPFIKSDPDAWDECVRINDDPYGAAAVRYAARWANYMERLIDDGEALVDIAEQALRDADLEGITGFMYGCAVSILSQVWQHGEQLRRWHNLKTQIGTEGEKANESGAVLSPAIINIW